MRRLPKLDDGSTRAVILRNVVRLVHYGFSTAEAFKFALGRVGLTRLPAEFEGDIPTIPVPPRPLIH